MLLAKFVPAAAHLRRVAVLAVVTALLCVSIPSPATAVQSPPSPLSFESVAANPRDILTGIQVNVLVEARIVFDETQGPITATLERIDANGNYLFTEGEMFDSTNPDGVFSIYKPFTAQNREIIRLRVRALRTSTGSSALSEPILLRGYRNLTSTEMGTTLTVQQDALRSYDQKVKKSGQAGAIAQVVNELRANPNVREAGPSEDNTGFWIYYAAGTLGTVLVDNGKTRGGSAAAPGPRLAPMPAPLQAPPPAEIPKIGSRKAIVFDAFYTQFSRNDGDEGPAVRDMLNASTCPKFSPVVYVKDGQATVNTLKTLSDYGVIALITHGASSFAALTDEARGLVMEVVHEPVGTPIFCLATGETVVKENRQHDADLANGRVATITVKSTGVTYYLITPEFIYHYAESKPYARSLVYAGACESTKDDSFSTAFFGCGAAFYLGYSKIVNSKYAAPTGRQFFQRFLQDPTVHSADEAFLENLPPDPDPPGAFFEAYAPTEDADLAMPSPYLENGSFEDVAGLAPWSRFPDGAPYPTLQKQYGPFKPTNGQYMAFLRMNAGFNAVEQTICLQPGATTLTFDWNIISGEMKEACGDPATFALAVEIVTPAGQVVARPLEIQRDALCETVFPTTLDPDDGTYPCTPYDNDCVAWATGWRTQTVNLGGAIPANTPMKVRIGIGRFQISWLYVVALVDNVRIS